ncbi:hypothetical protein GO988_08555 [Hymenobacter sp. HMF4947]|uniref:DUF3575 domain-containing protein n=1 Tax=Hymenobacter ginkgonis TaxID=2682976 RepID=A0A7K1TDA1_9BACT|nr:hypothetical protein [Hymenobacter ginkgonis]MVN76373.1 hypothetical protein [Hymenobacter ginkgonis]
MQVCTRGAWLAWGRWAGCLALVLLSWRAPAQAPRSWSLKFTPQHVVLSGYWLEVERTRSSHPNQTFTLGPQLYAGPTGRPDVGYDPSRLAFDETVRGAGLQAQHRFYLAAAGGQRAYPTGLYLGYGPQIQFFRLNFSRGWEWREEAGPGGLPYLVYTPVRHHETVLRLGVAGQVGYQLPLARRVLLDLYAGVGVRHSTYWSVFEASQYRSGPSDYAHQGIYFPAGFKLGVALR